MAFWHWLILGALLVLAEVLVPGTWLLWPGIAALLTGILAFLLPGLGWEAHALVFAVLTVLAAVAGRQVYKRLREPAGGDPNLNRRGHHYVGTVHTLDTAIADGAGRMRVGDTTWKVSGPDLPAGTRVRVVDVDGIVLKVEKTE